jgi:hypothetical protein
LAEFFGITNNSFQPSNNNSIAPVLTGIQTGRNNDDSIKNSSAPIGVQISHNNEVKTLSGLNNSPITNISSVPALPTFPWSGNLNANHDIETRKNSSDKNPLFTFRNTPISNPADDNLKSKSSIFNISAHSRIGHPAGSMEIEDLSSHHHWDFHHQNNIGNPSSMEITGNPSGANLAQSNIFQVNGNSKNLFPLAPSQSNNLLFQNQHNLLGGMNKNGLENGGIMGSNVQSIFPSNLNNNNNNGIFGNTSGSSQNLFTIRRNEQEVKGPYGHIQNFNIFQNERENNNTPTFAGFPNNITNQSNTTSPNNFQTNTPFFANPQNITNNDNNNFLSGNNNNFNANNVFDSVDKTFARSLFDKKPDALKGNTTNSLSLFSVDDRQIAEKPKAKVVDPTLERMLKKGQPKPLRLNP